MTPETILQTIRAIALATAETAKWLQTPTGQVFMERSFEREDAFVDNMKALKNWFEKLVTGKLT